MRLSVAQISRKNTALSTIVQGLKSSQFIDILFHLICQSISDVQIISEGCDREEEEEEEEGARERERTSTRRMGRIRNGKGFVMFLACPSPRGSAKTSW